MSTFTSWVGGRYFLRHVLYIILSPVRNPFSDQRYLVAVTPRCILLMQWFQPHQTFKHVMVGLTLTPLHPHITHHPQRPTHKLHTHTHTHTHNYAHMHTQQTDCQLPQSLPILEAIIEETEEYPSVCYGVREL